jgi:hypothetical protein
LTLVTLGQLDWIGRGSPFRHGINSINSIAGPSVPNLTAELQQIELLAIRALRESGRSFP